MRTFIAIDLPLSIKTELEKIQEDFKKCNLSFKWVKPENTHLTLKFLGNTSDEQLDKIKKIITKVSQSFSVFEARFIEFGFFPNERRPRVFFISTSGEDLLKAIADLLEEELAKIGFKPEGRFKSHITLARIKTLENVDCLKRKIKQVKISEKFPVKEITLFKSTLTRGGPIYEKIFKSNLAN